jgi:protocatechuate 3,4-dioxygenase beta subunit
VSSAERVAERHREPPSFEGRALPHPDEPVFDQGLTFDVGVLSRREILRGLGFGAIGAGLFAIAGCAPGGSTAAPTAAGSSAAADSCALIPEETAGPFPGDGTNGPDVLTESGVVRQDIRASIGGSSTVATGVPLTIRLAIQDQENGCAPLDAAAVYLWHCDQQGRYSMYSEGVTNENYLRGVQAAGADGVVTFTSVFPGCYAGRWPHIHFEVYPSLESATDAANIIATSQIALPKAACDQVYAGAGYEQSVGNLAGVSLDRDGVFGEDGGAHQLGTMSGTTASGLTVDLAVPVAAAQG